jgi:hypothetical protein
MSFLFSAPSAPQVQPLPPSPADTTQAEARAAATRDAIARAKAGGRSSTIVGGMTIQDDGSEGTGLLAPKNKAASRTLVG